MPLPNCIQPLPAPVNQCPPNNTLLPFFAEISICDILTIPTPKPDIEAVSAVSKNFTIEDVEILDVNLGDVQGRKAYIAGTLTLGIEYSALVETQEVHFAHFNLPYKALIRMRPCPGAYRGLLPPDFNINNYYIRICIEHEQFHILDPRTIQTALVVLVWLEPKTP
jgi:hypothetical protein